MGDQPQGARSSEDKGKAQAPFPVATLKDQELNLRAYFNSQGRAEWIWSRVQAYLGIQGYGGHFLSSNRMSLEQDMMVLEVPTEQLHYKPKGYVGTQNEPWKDHTLESRALLSLLMTCLKSKPLKPIQKDKAFAMCISLAKICLVKAFDMNQVPAFPHVTLCEPDGSFKMGFLRFTKEGLCQGWGFLVQGIPGVQGLWNKMCGEAWRGHTISSHWEMAKMEDILAFLLFLATSPKLVLSGQTLWECVGKGALPNLLFFIAECMDVYATSLSHEPLAELPGMKTRKGNPRKKGDQVNQLIVMDRLKQERLHRWRIARTHSNLVTQHCKLMKSEAYISSVLHNQANATMFAGLKQVSVAWDPSSYGGRQTFVGMVYSAEKDLASYLLVQPLRNLLVSDLHEDLQEAGRRGRLKRVEGYVELRGLSAALRNLGLSLMDFDIPAGLHLAPLTANQLRLQQGDQWYIMNTEDGTVVPQIPAGLKLEQLPVLISISDQGPSNMAALNFLQFSAQALLCVCIFDPFHRAWNDLKLACRRATAYPWRTLLELTLVYNLAYGPFGSGSWFIKKQDCLRDFLAQESASSHVFQDHLHLICREMGVPEPQTLAEQQDFFNQLANLRSFSEKGPLVKLMRWFSYFDSALFYSGELFATRMVLLTTGANYDEDADEDLGPPLDPEATAAKDAKDPRAALAELKKKKGTWKLAPQLITNTNVDNQQMMLIVCRATWKHHASRARTLKSPKQVLAYNVAAAIHGKWAEELEDMVRHSCWERPGLEKQFKEEAGEDRSQLLQHHANFFEELLSVRAASLATATFSMPMRYNGTLSSDPGAAAQAFAQVKREWNILLQAEAAVAMGGRISFLNSLVWRKNPFIRALYLAYEQDLGTGCSLQRHVAQNLGDSRVVEVAHSQCKDILRQARTNTPSLTAIQHQLLMSGALEEREVPCIGIAPADKIFATSQERHQPLMDKMNPRSMKLPLSLQKMMEKPSVATAWPSPSPASMFGILASTEWLFKFWDGGFPPVALEKAWMTLLAGKPGTVVAQRSSGLLMKVVQAVEFGMLAWILDVQMEGEQAMYLMKPKRTCLGWFHIWDVSDWVVVPTQAQLVNPGVGPVAWIKVADPITLPMAICKEGVQITVKQIKHLLLELGIDFPSNMRRAALQALLIESCLDDPEDRAAAMAKVKEGAKVKENDIDSDLDEVLSALGDDEANYAEIKQFRKERAKKKKAAKEQEVPTKPRGRGRGRGKGRGKGRGSGKGKGKGNFAKRVKKSILKKGHEQSDPQPAAEPTLDQEAEDKAMPFVESDLPAEEGLDDEPFGGAAAASSSGAAPSIDYEKDMSKKKKEETLADDPPMKKSRQPKIKSPEEVLGQITPPGVTIGMLSSEHRFTSRMMMESPLFVGKMRQKYFTCSFGKRTNWQDALATVHEFCWRKWYVVREQLPLPEGMAEQVPGRVPPDILTQLGPHIEKLPPLKDVKKHKAKAK
eukprot:Skav208248  [mRNA]  locus=scaffold7893:752:5170:+ [translate_table: standard]